MRFLKTPICVGRWPSNVHAFRPLVFRRRKDQVHPFTRRMDRMARKPNYDFERRERERLKNLKNAARAEAKLKAPADQVATGAPDDVATGAPDETSTTE